MATATDVRSKKLTTTGATALMGSGRVRVKGIYFVCGASAGKILLQDGSASGATLIDIDTPALATWTEYHLIPGDGVLSQGDPYLTLTNVTSVTLYFG